MVSDCFDIGVNVDVIFHYLHDVSNSDVFFILFSLVSCIPVPAITTMNQKSDVTETLTVLFLFREQSDFFTCHSLAHIVGVGIAR